jgi:hypothetical protein
MCFRGVYQLAFVNNISSRETRDGIPVSLQYLYKRVSSLYLHYIQRFFTRIFYTPIFSGCSNNTIMNRLDPHQAQYRHLRHLLIIKGPLVVLVLHPTCRPSLLIVDRWPYLTPFNSYIGLYENFSVVVYHSHDVNLPYAKEFYKKLRFFYYMV